MIDHNEEGVKKRKKITKSMIFVPKRPKSLKNTSGQAIGNKKNLSNMRLKSVKKE